MVISMHDTRLPDDCIGASALMVHLDNISSAMLQHRSKSQGAIAQLVWLHAQYSQS